MAADKYKSVAQLTQEIQDTLECDFSSVTVCGEVSGFSAPRSGHWYLTLKDDSAQISAVCWRSTVARQRVQIEDGLKVVVRGRITVYAPRGNYQLIIDQIAPLGEGSWRAAFKKLHQKLSAEGLFNADRKKTLPAIPDRVVVITSPSGAAIRDFLQVATRRWQAGEIIVLPTRVQGQGAGQQLAAAVKLAEQIRPRPDVLVLTRGGGSVEDLWEFNHEDLIRSIAACPIPIVSGVGHEIDVTLCDLAADMRALTPSEAAERIFPDRQVLTANLQQTHRQMQSMLTQKWQDARRQVQQLANSKVLSDPISPLRVLAQRVDEFESRMQVGVDNLHARHREALAGTAARLHSLSPLNILSRGYSLTLTQDGKPLSDVTDLSEGQTLITRLDRGQIQSRIEKLIDED